MNPGASATRRTGANAKVEAWTLRGHSTADAEWCTMVATLFLSGRSAFVGTCAAQYVGHGVIIALMAGVLEQPVREVLLERIRDAPGPGPCFRVVDRHFIQQRLRIGAREALDNPKRVARRNVAAVTPGAELAIEVRRFDDQRIAVPAAAGVSHVSPN